MATCLRLFFGLQADVLGRHRRAAPDLFPRAGAALGQLTTPLDPPRRIPYTPPVALPGPQESTQAAFGRSRRWGSHPAKEKRHETA